MSQLRRPTAVLLAVLALLALSACVPPAAEPVPTATAASESSTPTPDPPTEEPEPSLDDADRANIADAISSGNTAAIDGYLADTVDVTLAASECCGPIPRAEAITNLNYILDPGATWNFSPTAERLAEYRAGWYGPHFPDDVIVGVSSNGNLVSFGIAGDQIVSILMGGEETILS